MGRREKWDIAPYCTVLPWVGVFRKAGYGSAGTGRTGWAGGESGAVREHFPDADAAAGEDSRACPWRELVNLQHHGLLDGHV